jgi:hypothetical protein
MVYGGVKGEQKKCADLFCVHGKKEMENTEIESVTFRMQSERSAN